MTSKYHWDESDLVITSGIEKHLSGKHQQSTHAGNKKSGAEASIRQKKMTGYWGYSRTGSTSIATASRDIMGIPSRVNVASRNLSETDYEQAEIALDNISSRPTMVSVPLAHTTSRMPELESVQAGSVIKLGLTATAKHKVGEYDQGYAEDYISEMQVLVFTGTKPTHLYSGRRNAPEEAIVAGEFKVVGKETVDVPRSRFRNGVYESWTGKATVVQLEQVSTFDTTTKAFVPFKSSVEKHLGGKHDQSTHAGKKKGGATGASETSSASDLNDAFWKSNDAQKALPYEESRSVEEYTRTAHHNVNMYLRGKLEEDNLQYSSSKKIASSLDSAFEKTSVASSTDGVVYRGITTEARKVSDSWASKLKAGDLIEDKGFMSTSQSQEVSESFSRNGTFVGVQFVISVPKGTRVMAGSETESELVLNRGTKMKVTKVTENESRDEQPWRVQIELEVVQ